MRSWKARSSAVIWWCVLGPVPSVVTIWAYICFLLSDAFNDSSDALSHTNAHHAESVASAAAVQFVHRGRDQPGARHAERVAEGDGSTVWIYMGSVVGQTKVAQHGE